MGVCVSKGRTVVVQSVTQSDSHISCDLGIDSQPYACVVTDCNVMKQIILQHSAEKHVRRFNSEYFSQTERNERASERASLINSGIFFIIV